VRTVGDLRRLATLTGSRLVGVHTVAGELVGDFDVPDIDEGHPFAPAFMLEALAADDARTDPLPSRLIRWVRSRGARGPAAAHSYVLDHVRFQDEDVETFQRPTATLRLGYGDCDDSARVLRALASQSGIAARFVYFVKKRTPIHVCAQLWDRGRWQWAETTIPAHYGECPLAALERLGLDRPDIDGAPVVLKSASIGSMHATRGGHMLAHRFDGAIAGQGRQGRRQLRALVQRVATPVTAQALADALAAAWPSVVGGDPGQAIPILVAQSDFETGTWAACWNWNLGNVKTGSNWTGDFFNMTAGEGSAGQTMVASSWRSYPDLESGAAAWLGVLAAGYSSALGYAEAGDLANFVQALSDGGYFTADERTYYNGVAARYANYQSLVPSAAAGQVGQVNANLSTPVAIGAVLACVVLGATLAVASS
jgi:hypothetical protein